MKILGASSLPSKVRPLSAGLRCLAVLSIVAGAGFAAATAEAAPTSHAASAKPAKEAVTSVVAKDVDTTSSVQPTTGSDATCNISRKRLFVEGEGWIVRRVATCY